MIRKKITWFLLVFMMLSCDSLTDSNEADQNDASGKLYVALQGMGNKIAILNSDNLELIEMIDASFSNGEIMMEMPHYIAIDNINGYWFVTTMGSSSVGMYSIESNQLLDVINLESPPALFEIDTSSQSLYVSRMPNVDLLGSGMAMGSNSSMIDKINYTNNEMMLELTYDTEFPSPHAISISENSDKLVTASLTYDFLTRIDIGANEIQSVSLEPSINPDPIPDINRLKPLEIVQKNGFAFINCMGGVWNDQNVNGQVQVWSVDNLSKISEYQFGVNSNPWHIIHHPFENKIYVALSGYLDGNIGESGLVQLSYSDDGVLVLDWENMESSLKLLHGIDISENGEYIYISSRDGRIFKFNSNSGDLLVVTDLSTPDMPYPAPGGIKINH